MKINSKAKIYLSEEAFGKQYKKIGFLHIPIGIKKPKELDRIVFIDKNIKISPDIRIYVKLENMKLIIGDDSLLTKKGDKLVMDLFDHEIYLVIENENSNVLFSGCSHKGIENIVDVLEKKESRSITHVLGGFHMSHYDTKNSAQTIYLESLGQKFYKKNVKTFYSCHCTGDNAYDALKPQMMEKLVRIKTGTVINL